MIHLSAGWGNFWGLERYLVIMTGSCIDSKEGVLSNFASLRDQGACALVLENWLFGSVKACT